MISGSHLEPRLGEETCQETQETQETLPPSPGATMGNTLFGGAAKVSAGCVSAAAAAVLQVLVASRRPRCHEHGAEDQQGELLPHVTRDT